MPHFWSISFKSSVLTSILGAFWDPKRSQNEVRERSEWGSKACQNFGAIFGRLGAVDDSVLGWFWGGWRQRRWPAEGGEASLSV